MINNIGMTPIFISINHIPIGVKVKIQGGKKYEH